MRAMRSSPAASRIERTTVVLPEPVPPATPRMQGLGAGIAASGSSSGAGSSTAWLAPRTGRSDGVRTPGFYRLRPAGRVPGAWRSSALAVGAVESAAAGLDQAADEMATPGAGLALAAVGGQRDLELATASLAVGEVVER